MVLAAQGEVTVQWDLRGQGSKGKVPQDGMQEVAATLQRWGETPAAVRRIISAAQRRVSQKPVGEVVVLDWGTGWEGMKEGTSRVVRTYGIDRERHLRGQKEGYTVPDLIIDISKLGAAPVQQVLNKAKVSAAEHPYSHFSPDCDPETKAQHLEAAQGRGKGLHAGEDRDHFHQSTLDTIVRGIVTHRAAHPEWVYTVEQPEGSAMATDPGVIEHLGQPVKLRQCCYGR